MVLRVDEIWKSKNQIKNFNFYFKAVVLAVVGFQNQKNLNKRFQLIFLNCGIGSSEIWKVKTKKKFQIIFLNCCIGGSEIWKVKTKKNFKLYF